MPGRPGHGTGRRARTGPVTLGASTGRWPPTTARSWRPAASPPASGWLTSAGTGQTTRDAAAAAGPGPALGVDLSARMIELARRLAAEEGTGNVSFEQADAQIYPFPAGSFDVAISRTGTMFFGDPAAAFANIGRALRPGGRLVMLVWQGPGPNEWVRELSGALAAGRDLPAPPPGAPGPFSLADPGRVRALLAAAGFSGITMEALHEP